MDEFEDHPDREDQPANADYLGAKAVLQGESPGNASNQKYDEISLSHF